MGIYYFAVDYDAREQMWAPHSWSDKCISCPGHPLPAMVAMQNCRGSNFEFINDVSSYDEHSFQDVTQEVYDEWFKVFSDAGFDMTEYKEMEK